MWWGALLNPSVGRRGGQCGEVASGHLVWALAAGGQGWNLEEPIPHRLLILCAQAGHGQQGERRPLGAGVRGEAEGAWSGARQAGPHSDVRDLRFYYVRGPWRILSRRLHWSDLFMLLKTICASIETSFPLVTLTGNRLTSKEKLSFP